MSGLIMSRQAAGLITMDRCPATSSPHHSQSRGISAQARRASFSAKPAERASIVRASGGSAARSIIASSMPRSRQYISKAQGETSQPMKNLSACAITGAIRPSRKSIRSSGNR